MLESATLKEIVAHLGGSALLSEVGVHNFATDDSHVSFQFFRSNPRNVHAVTIALQSNGQYTMMCFGKLIPGTFTSPKLAEATDIIAENLATVLGQLTGIERLHHRHY